jgi:hypothetical protein
VRLAAEDELRFADWFELVQPRVEGFSEIDGGTPTQGTWEEEGAI